MVIGTPRFWGVTPSAPFEIARDPIDQLAVNSRRRPKRNIKTPSCGIH